MKTILILHTGGTISMRTNQQDGSVITNSVNPLTEHIGQLHTPANILQEEIFNMPSPHISEREMLLLKERIARAIQENIDGVVITHGTDTLEETAYFLDLTLNTNIPIILTGAMRSSNELGADGLTNLQNAILVALNDHSKQKGVLVVMNDEIHTAKFVTKTHTTNVATFQTPTFGPIGLISHHKVLYFQSLITTETYDVDQLVHNNIVLLKAHSGMDSFLLNILADSHLDGVVIEALGAGNLPPKTLAGIQKLLQLRIPIVLVSRAFNGITQDIYDYLGGGKQLKNSGVIFSTGLNGQKARIKLMVLLNTPLENTLQHYFE